MLTSSPTSYFVTLNPNGFINLSSWLSSISKKPNSILAIKCFSAGKILFGLELYTTNLTLARVGLKKTIYFIPIVKVPLLPRMETVLCSFLWLCLVKIFLNTAEVESKSIFLLSAVNVAGLYASADVKNSFI